MEYLVIVRYLPYLTDEWQTIQHEFGTEEGATAYAEEMYETHAREVNVLMYHLVKSFN